ncbi:unnamed protein product [Ectocarpus sp. 13 AM-2016]
MTENIRNVSEIVVASRLWRYGERGNVCSDLGSVPLRRSLPEGHLRSGAYLGYTAVPGVFSRPNTSWIVERVTHERSEGLVVGGTASPIFFQLHWLLQEDLQLS